MRIDGARLPRYVVGKGTWWRGHGRDGCGVRGAGVRRRAWCEKSGVVGGSEV